MSYSKFMLRKKFFSFIIKEGIKILAQEGEETFMYCDPDKVPEEAKEDLAIILADMTLECNFKIGKAS